LARDAVEPDKLFDKLDRDHDGTRHMVNKEFGAADGDREQGFATVCRPQAPTGCTRSGMTGIG
jgi:hypothetical protein